mmetsp:Transcript_63245/g.150853  ORF Transcript_63245/g.150853 Transcript_63245/m.150853 type:complete len:851 (-) Transcript_63245:131-2683(-)
MDSIVPRPGGERDGGGGLVDDTSLQVDSFSVVKKRGGTESKNRVSFKAQDKSQQKQVQEVSKELVNEIVTECKNNLAYFHGRALTSLSAFLDDCSMELSTLRDSVNNVLVDAEASHQLEVARLSAEMATLKEKLGMKGDVALPQTMLYTPDNKRMAAANARGTGGRAWQPDSRPSFGEKGGTGETRKRSFGNEVAVAGAKAGKSAAAALRGGGTTAPTGSWQHFVAWVPSGVSLGVPTPWKAQPDGPVQVPTHGLAAGMPVSGPSKQSVKAPAQESALARNPTQGTLPGTITMTDALDPLERSKALTQSQNSNVASAEHDFEVLEAWELTEAEKSKLQRHGKSRSYSGETSDWLKGSASTGAAVSRGIEIRGYARESGFMKHVILHPHSYKRVVWDFVSLFLVVYDMIMIPMSVFDMDDSTFLEFMEWTTRLFWTIDMPTSCITGIVQADGLVNMKLKPILRNYLRTWFTPDLLIVLSDWISYIVAAGGIGLLGRASRIFRIIRVVRLLRLMKLARAMEVITERIQSDSVAVAASILKLVLAMLALAHLTACLWWGVGKTRSQSWITLKNFDDEPVESQYLLSLHWSLTQFNGGMDEVVPGNSTDRLYAVTVWTFAFMFGAMIVSMLTSKLTQLYMIEGAQSRNMAILRKYLAQNSISRNLALRVQRSAKHALLGDLTDDMVELLAIVSEPLRVEMHFEMYAKAFFLHPFFSCYLPEYPQEARRLCRWAMMSSFMDEGDIIFSEGETPRTPKMYIVIRGKLIYTFNSEEEEVTEKQWVSEAALWTNWQHTGDLMAASDSKLLLFDATVFQDIASQFKHPTINPKTYAADFVAKLNKSSAISDLMDSPYVK